MFLKLLVEEQFNSFLNENLKEDLLLMIFSSQVDTFDINICTAKTQRHVIDFQVMRNVNIFFEDFQTQPFQTAHETDLHRIEIPLEFHMLSSGREQIVIQGQYWLVLTLK